MLILIVNFKIYPETSFKYVLDRRDIMQELKIKTTLNSL